MCFFAVEFYGNHRPPVYITDPGGFHSQVELMGPYVLEDQNVHQGNSLVIDLLAGIQFMGSLSFPTLMLTKGGGHLFEGFRVNP